MAVRTTDSDNAAASVLPAEAEDPDAAEPGLLLIFAAGRPYCTSLPLSESPLEIGRGAGVLTEHPDTLMSRHHARATYCQGTFTITDLGSRNGSAVDGAPLQGTVTVGAGVIVRLGGSLFMSCQDLRPFQKLGVSVTDGRIHGPSLQRALRTIIHIAASHRILHIIGESGAGKESFAQTFHRACAPAGGPLVTLNCATIPEGIAERLLFGSRKGAFSGATTDSEGYFEAANGGTLFLDEIAELAPTVQGKLLRVIETGEFVQLGATRPRKVHFRVCTATHRDLRVMIQDGRFRSDLYYRIGMPQVTVPSLRQRREEIPWLIVGAVQSVSPGLGTDVTLVESCLLRSWPGNVRELMAEVRTAAHNTSAEGKSVVTRSHLSASAGIVLQPTAPEQRGKTGTDDQASPGQEAAGTVPMASMNQSKGSSETTLRSRHQVIAALLTTKSNISAAARLLQLHRTQLRRLLVDYKINPDKLRKLS